jgi:hypothetical protein
MAGWNVGSALFLSMYSAWGSFNGSPRIKSIHVPRRAGRFLRHDALGYIATWTVVDRVHRGVEGGTRFKKRPSPRSLDTF